MEKYTIKVRNECSGGSINHRIPDDQEPAVYEVEAYCVGGDEGVWAIYQSPSNPELLEYAQGDDGFWWFAGTMHKWWFPQMAEAIINAVKSERKPEWPNRKNDPYITTYSIQKEDKYNPEYGDDRECKCGHPYYRHFDSYENNYPCGCKYCSCFEFEEK